MNENQQKTLVIDFLSNYGLKADHIPEGKEKTPDFKVYKNDDLKFYCELKSLNDPWLDEKLEDAEF